MADIGISLPGTGEIPVAPVYENGEKTVTLKGDNIAHEFQKLLMTIFKKTINSWKNINPLRFLPMCCPNNKNTGVFFMTRPIQILDRYAYQEIKLPVVESTDLYIHSVGEQTDIVEKEMYSWQDSLTKIVWH